MSCDAPPWELIGRLPRCVPPGALLRPARPVTALGCTSSSLSAMNPPLTALEPVTGHKMTRFCTLQTEMGSCWMYVRMVRGSYFEPFRARRNSKSLSQPTRLTTDAMSRQYCHSKPKQSTTKSNPHTVLHACYATVDILVIQSTCRHIIWHSILQQRCTPTRTVCMQSGFTDKQAMMNLMRRKSRLSFQSQPAVDYATSV